MPMDTSSSTRTTRSSTRRMMEEPIAIKSLTNVCGIRTAQRITRSALNPTSSRGPETALIWAIAAFPRESCPRVSALQFGLDWPINGNPLTFLDWGSCASFEIATNGWPEDRRTGTALAWSLNPVKRTGFPVYWFAAYSYYGPLEVSVFNFPSGPAAFADDSVPSILDPIPEANRGVIGLNGAVGWNPYVLQTPVGACCTDDGQCTLTTETACTTAGNEYIGDGVSCDPNPCNVTPVLETTWGGVKSVFRQ